MTEEHFNEPRLHGLWALNEVNLVPIASKSYFQEQVGNAVVTLRTLNEDCTHILWSVEQAIRITFTEDRDPVPGAAGHLFPDGSGGVWPAELASMARIIRNGAANALFCVTQLTRMT